VPALHEERPVGHQQGRQGLVCKVCGACQCCRAQSNTSIISTVVPSMRPANAARQALGSHLPPSKPSHLAGRRYRRAH
jgi:hypothetical protein